MSKKTSEPDDFPEAAWKEMWKARPYALGVKAWGCRNVALAAARWAWGKRGEGRPSMYREYMSVCADLVKAEAARDAALKQKEKRHGKYDSLHSKAMKVIEQRDAALERIKELEETK